MGLLSDLKALGLGQFEDAKIIEDPAKKKAEEVVVVKTPEELEKEAVFVRNIKCPVCDHDVSLLALRPGKAKLEGTDSDLRPKYEKMDPIKYDAIACNSCGFAALTKYFGHLASRQVRDIKEQISPSFKGFEFKGELYSYDDAILRYKLALASEIVKKAKNSEKAYTALKLAWVFRGKRESLSKDEAKKEENKQEIITLFSAELEALKIAYDGFTIAISKESEPIAGMDSLTVQYLLADLARRLKKYDEASRLCAGVLTNQSVQPRLKERAYDLKVMIQEEVKKQKEAAAANEEAAKKNAGQASAKG